MGITSNNVKAMTSVLWECADILRTTMGPNDYMEYILPFMFYKYLSDENLKRIYNLLSTSSKQNEVSLEEMQKLYESAKEDPEEWQDLKDELIKEQKFFIEPEMTFTYLISKIREQSFKREDLESAFKAIEACDNMYQGLFKDVDLYSSKLGTNAAKQAQTIIDLLIKFNELNLNNYDGDAIGDAYEYMIGQFASETGKKAGEFYTPKKVSEILTRISIMGQEDKKGLLVYDPAMGSGSLLLDARHYSNHKELVMHYGQEIMLATYNLARMNMILHGVAPEKHVLRNGDTLDADWPTTEETEFDMVVMNPPYSLNWSAAEGFKTDKRFSQFGGNLPPKSKADYAFLLHGYFHLKNTGTMAIVLPHGVLFRGASEGKIRQILCEKGAIYAVIGLPEKLFYNTGIPTIIMVLKKQRENNNRDILFIDASKEFEKNKTQNTLTEEHIETILNMYTERKDVEKHAHLASFDEIKENEFNLNIPRYVDTSEDEEPVNIKEVIYQITNIDEEIKTLNKNLYENIKELTSDDESAKEDISAILNLFEGWL